MFVDESKDAEVRIIDFGLSQKFAADQHLHDAVGTVYVCIISPDLRNVLIIILRFLSA